MDKRLTIGLAVFAVFSLLIQATTMLAVIPAPKAATAPVTALPQARSTASTATNFNDLNANEVDAVTLNATTGNITTANITTLNVGGIAQSGTVRFGTGSTVISGTKLAHGFGITPTVFLVEPSYVQPSTYTQTIYAFGCGTVSCTVGLSEGSVITYTSVWWMSGK